MTAVYYLLAAAILLGLIALSLWLREYRLGLRARLLRQILDRADALEATLHECRTRLREIPALVATLPPSASLSAKATLTAEPEVQAALRDLLAHRLWLKEHGGEAPLAKLRSASAALEQSQAALSGQLQRLAEVRSELQRARAAAPHMPAGSSP